MPRIWLSAVWNVLALLLLGTVLGWLAGQTLIGLLLGALFCLAWHLRQLYLLEHWMRGGDWSLIPNEGGVWGAIYLRFVRLRSRSRKRKRKLSRILKQFQEAVAALPDAVIALNEDDHVLWFNRTSGQLLGLRSQDVNLPITLFLRHPQFVTFINEAPTARGTESVIDFPSPLDDNLQLRARLVAYGKRQRLLIIMDTTQAQRFEQVRRDFVANASHELRTPLTVLAGYLETMTDSDEPCAELWQKPLHHMRQQTARMQHIIESLLMLSRLENEPSLQNIAAVPVAKLIPEMIADALLLDSGGGQEITLEIDKSLFVAGSRQELSSAFSNLVFNAVRHTDTGTRITIRWFADDEGVYFQVEDNGEGIASQHLPRLSERFYRVDRARQREQGSGGKGTGLGLAIVKHVMQRHDGELEIESELGNGSRFTCIFPPARRIVSSEPADPDTHDNRLVEALPDQALLPDRHNAADE